MFDVNVPTFVVNAIELVVRTSPGKVKRNENDPPVGLPLNVSSLTSPGAVLFALFGNSAVPSRVETPFTVSTVPGSAELVHFGLPLTTYRAPSLPPVPFRPPVPLIVNGSPTIVKVF